jgi:carbonic anhydrase
LRHVQDVRQKHTALLEAVPDEDDRANRLCELNVIEQVMNVCETTIVQDAWLRGQELSVHGLVYALNDGRIRDLEVCVAALSDIQPAYGRALSLVRSGLVSE